MLCFHEVDTPGVMDEYDVNSHLIEEFMSNEEAAKYRGPAAKPSYTSLENPMIASAYQEASTSMSSPEQAGR